MEVVEQRQPHVFDELWVGEDHDRDGAHEEPVHGSILQRPLVDCIVVLILEELGEVSNEWAEGRAWVEKSTSG